MTIDQRLEDAEFLWQSGRHEGAFLMALIAFAATARKAYPNEKADSKAFERLFQDQFSSGTSVRFRDDLLPMNRLFTNGFAAIWFMRQACRSASRSTPKMYRASSQLLL